ncbi:MAG: hypothetical protein LJF06_12100 [Gemmatimonadetes bacterium]|nr:hypothetical protein [Gemmatimonadota bacterium]
MRGGDLPSTDTVAVTDAELYDAGLAEAVGRFQSRHLEKPLALADYFLAGIQPGAPSVSGPSSRRVGKRRSG